jgi:hypothetical protein
MFSRNYADTDSQAGLTSYYGELMKVEMTIKKLFYCGLISIAVVTSCQKRSFGGDGAKQDPVTPEPQPPKEEPVKCDPNTTISVSALTQTVDQYVADPIVEYQIDLKDCPDTTPVARAEQIQFDVDAVVTNKGGPIENPEPFDRSVQLPYKVLIEGVEQPISGTIAYKSGKDLFGKTGEYYGFFQTDQKIEFPAEKRRAKMTIHIGAIQLIKPAASDNNPTEPTMSIDTFFQFGSTTPVTVPVTFTRKN